MTTASLQGIARLCASLVLLAAAAFAPAWAADGRALVVAGSVVLERTATAPSAVIAGTEVERGDLIRTGADGRV